MLFLSWQPNLLLVEMRVVVPLELLSEASVTAPAAEAPVSLWRVLSWSPAVPQRGWGGRLCLCLYVCECVVYMWAWQHGQWHQMWVFSRELNLSSSYLHKHSVMSVGEGEMWNPYICCCSSPSSGIAVSRLIKGVGHCVCGWLGRPKKLHAF